MVIAMDTSPMTMKLHVPLKTFATLIARKQTGSEMASFDMRHQRGLAREACITYVAEEFTRDF